MKTTGVLGGLALVLCLVLPAAADPPETDPSVHEDTGRSGDAPAAPHQRGGGWHRRFEGHRGQWHGNDLGGRPVITIALHHRQELGLTPAQEEGLHRLRTDFQQEAIKRLANLRGATLDLAELLRSDRTDPGKVVEMPRVEAKIREIEQMRADLSIGRIRTIEQGKALLTAEQHEKLATLLERPWPPMRAGGCRPSSSAPR